MCSRGTSYPQNLVVADIPQAFNVRFLNEFLKGMNDD